MPCPWSTSSRKNSRLLALAQQASLHVGERQTTVSIARILAQFLERQHERCPPSVTPETLPGRRSAVLTGLTRPVAAGVNTSPHRRQRMSAGTTPDPHLSEDERLLHKLGYAQELFRAMGGFQNFAISFTIISILAGCLTSYYIAFESGGPIAVTWGWLVVGVFSTIISLAMAEIASSFPTAGGLYYWASKLGSPGWGWATGWFNLIGQIAVTAAIGYGLSTFAVVALRRPVLLREAPERLVRVLLQRDGLCAVRSVPARRMSDQCVRRSDHLAAQHGVGVLAHGGCRGDRDRAGRRSRSSPVALATSSRARRMRPGTAARRPGSATRLSGSSSASAC